MSTKQIEKELEKDNKELEKNLKKEENSQTENDKNSEPIQEFTPVIKEKKNPLSILGILLFIIITILVIAFLIFTGYNALNQNIISGVYIQDLNVSNMNKDLQEMNNFFTSLGNTKKAAQKWYDNNFGSGGVNGNF